MFPTKNPGLYTNILTQKENWIWIAAFVTNGVDAKGIPKSTEAKGCTVTHPYTFITEINRKGATVLLWAPSPSTVFFSPSSHYSPSLCSPSGNGHVSSLRFQQTLLPSSSP